MHTTHKWHSSHVRKPSTLGTPGCRNQQALEEVWSEVKRLKALRHQADLTPERKIEKTKKYLVRTCQDVGCRAYPSRIYLAVASMLRALSSMQCSIEHTLHLFYSSQWAACTARWARCICSLAWLKGRSLLHC